MKYKKIILGLLVFIISIGSYSYPVLKKGYYPWGDHLNLVQAKNYALGGTYKYEDENGVFISSENAVDKGIETAIPNPLTPIIYGNIFKIFGYNVTIPLLFSIILFSIFNVLLFILIARIFSTAVGFVGGLLSAFVPVMASGAIMPGFYEWGIIFFGMALWLYLGSEKGDFSSGKIRTGLSSVFFALSALARNAFAISFVPFFLYDFYVHRSWKRALVFLLPFVAIFGLTLTPYSWLGFSNGYFAEVNQPFQQPGHFFDDPYTMHFESDRFIDEKLSNLEGRHSVSYAIGQGRQVSLLERLGAHFSSAMFYAKELISMRNIGGPVVIGFIIIGAFVLFRQRRRLLELFAVWFIFLFGYLIYSRTGNWDHYMEVIFPLIAMLALGLKFAYESIKDYPLKKISAVFAVIFLIGHLVFASAWRMSELYRSSVMDESWQVAEEISGHQNDGTYAVSYHPEAAYAIAYLSDKNIIYFHPDTIERLKNEGRLNEVFNAYNATKLFGIEE